MTGASPGVGSEVRTIGERQGTTLSAVSRAARTNGRSTVHWSVSGRFRASAQ